MQKNGRIKTKLVVRKSIQITNVKWEMWAKETSGTFMKFFL